MKYVILVVGVLFFVCLIQRDNNEIVVHQEKIDYTRNLLTKYVGKVLKDEIPDQLPLDGWGQPIRLGKSYFNNLVSAHATSSGADTNFETEDDMRETVIFIDFNQPVPIQQKPAHDDLIVERN